MSESKLSRRIRNATYFPLILLVALTALFASMSNLRPYSPSLHTDTTAVTGTQQDFTQRITYSSSESIPTPCDQNGVDFMRLPPPKFQQNEKYTEVIPKCLSNQHDFRRNATRIIPFSESTVDGSTVVSQIRQNITAAICFLDKKLTNNFFHFPHAMQTIFPCWSFFRRVQRIANDRPIKIGFWLGRDDINFYEQDKKSHTWTIDLVQRMGACQMKPRQDRNYEWQDPKNITYAYVHHQSTNDHLLLYRMPKYEKSLGFDGGPCDQEMLRRRILGEEFLSTQQAQSNRSLSIGIINRNTTRRIANIVELKERLEREYPQANIDVSFMEDMSFIQQAEYWASHNVVIAGHGAAMTNTVFMSSESSLLIELFPPKLKNTMYAKLARDSGITRKEWRTPVAFDDNVTAMMNTRTLEGRKQARAMDLTPDIDQILRMIRRNIRWFRYD